jgi:hypothetical protein
MSHPTPFVWLDPEGQGRNVHAYFRYGLSLRATPKEAKLHLFADSNYHLRANGEFVGYGPVRFYPEFPEYDTYDLRAHLRPGRNVIAVHVLYNGFATFHTLANRPGFVAWGRARDGRGKAFDLATPGGWRCARATGYDAEAPRFSFAQGPIHLYDERKDLAGWDRPGKPGGEWHAPEIVPWQNAWGELKPRSIPYLTRDARTPARLLSAHEHLDHEDILSFRMIQHYDPKLHVPPPADGFARTQIYSPRAQKVRVGLYWGEHFLNGREIKKEAQRPEQLARSDAELDLREGWNAFFVHCGLVSAAWEFHMAVPKTAGLEFSPDGKHGDELAFRTAGPISREETQKWPPWKPDSLPQLLAALEPHWRPVKRDSLPASPAKGLAWCELGPALKLDPHVARDLSVAAGKPTSFIFDMGGEVLGRIFVELDGPEGTVVDVGHTEELKDSRPLPLGERTETSAGESGVRGQRPFLFKAVLVQAGERHVSRGGSSRLETFTPRGFRYLQVAVRNHDAPVVLRKVGVVSQVYPHEKAGSFACSDALLNEIWEMGWRTLRACSEDVYTDCPWRERTLYAGDLLPELATTLVTSGDTRLARRCLHIFLQSQSPEDESQQGMAPRERRGQLLGDYPLITLLIADWYVRYAKDREFSAYAFPFFQRMLNCLRATRAENGLFQGASQPFIDHVKQVKDGQVCALNALIARAYAALGGWARWLGKAKEAREYERLGRSTGAAVRRLFWDAQAGAFGDALVNGKLAAEHAISSSAWPSCYGLTTPAQEQGLQAHVGRRAEASELGRKEFCTPYGAFYLLGGLYEHGGEGLAEDLMRRLWGQMAAFGSDTVWEMFSPDNSLTHAWSSAPTYYLSTRALGVRLGFPEAADLSRVTIAPQSETFDWAAGVVPHPRGKVSVRWRVEGPQLVLDYAAPKGVRCDVRPQGRLAKLELWVNGKPQGNH